MQFTQIQCTLEPIFCIFKRTICESLFSINEESALEIMAYTLGHWARDYGTSNGKQRGVVIFKEFQKILEFKFE
jgi:hypothetical protein